MEISSSPARLLIVRLSAIGDVVHGLPVLCALREHLPGANSRLAPPLSPEQAAEAIFDGVERRKRTIVKPGILRALLALNAVAPHLVTSQLRRSMRKRPVQSNDQAGPSA